MELLIRVKLASYCQDLEWDIVKMSSYRYEIK